MALTHSPKIVRDGLVLHLDAANVKSYSGSGTTWKDLSGNGNNGTLVNGVGYSTNNKGAFIFDGVDDRISRVGTSSLATAGPVTMCSTFKKTSGEDGTLYRIQYGNESVFAMNFGSIGLFTQWWNLANGRVTHQSSFSFNNNIIYSVAATITPSNNGLTNTSNFYINGNFIESIQTTDSAARRSSPGTLFIGSGTNGAGSPIVRLTGEIYNTMYYNRALSAAEIQQNFDATRDRYGI